MKKRQKRLFSLLLACMMTCLPATQAFAETAFEASAGVSGQILFPGDSLVNAAGAVMVDGVEAALDETGAWVNKDENKVYTATSAEDGTVQVTQAGYVLVVEEGTASRAEGEDIDNHYVFLDWEKPLEGEPEQDIACYQSGETVQLVANAPEAGMEFAYWSTETDGVVISNPYNMETTIVMPEKKAEIKANYEAAAAPEDTADTPAETPVEDPTDITVDITQETTSYDVVVNNGEGAGSYAAGDWVSVTAYDRTEENLEFSGWYVDSMNVALDDAASEFTGFVMPEAAVTVSATYTEIQQEPTTYDVVVNDGTGAGAYEESTWVTVTANDRTAENKQFAGWVVDTQNVTLDDAYASTASFTMPAGGVTLTATYTDIQTQPAAAEVTVDYGTGSGTYEAGTVVSVTAEDRTAEGYEFEGWFVETMNAELEDASALSTSFTMPQEDVTIAATYSAVDEDIITDEPEDVQDEADDEPGIVDEEPDADEPGADDAESGDDETEIIVDEPDTDNSGETEVTEPETSAEETEAVTGAPETEVVELENQEAAQPEQATETPVTAETNQTNAPADDAEMYTVTVDAEAGTAFGAGDYAEGDQVTVEVNVADNEKVIDWMTEGAETVYEISGNTISFTMPAGDVTVTPVIEQTYQVTLKNNASIAGSGATKATYSAGDVVSVVAALQNDEGENFTGWKAYDAETKEKISLEFTQGDTLNTATFVMPEQDIIVKGVYKASYVVKVSNGLINDSVTQMSVTEGTKIKVTANQGPTGQSFAGWYINDGTFDMGEATYEPEIWIKVTQDMTIQATYEGYQYTVSVNNGHSDYDFGTAGSVVTIEADAAPEGQQFDYWYVDTQNVALTDANKETTTFVMPEGDVTVTAHYKQIEFSVTLGSGTAAQQVYHTGDTVTVSSSYPASGRVFDKWVAVSGNVTFADATRWQTTFTMPASDVVIKATYKDGPSAANNVIQDIIAGGEYLTGSTIKFTAVGAGMDNTNPNPGDYRYRPSGYQIGNVTGTWQSAPYSTSMSIKAAGEYTLKVIYNKDVYDGTQWVSEGTSDSKSVTFYVVTEAAGVATGDDTPVAVVIAVAGVSCVLFVILLVVFLRRRSRK